MNERKQAETVRELKAAMRIMFVFQKHLLKTFITNLPAGELRQDLIQLARKYLDTMREIR